MCHLLRHLVLSVFLVPGLAFGFPTLKSKEEFLPVLHALITIQEEVVIEGAVYKIEFKKDANGNEILREVRDYFSGKESVVDEKFTENHLESLFKSLSHVFEMNIADGTGACPFMHPNTSASSSSNPSKSIELKHFLNAVKLMILNRGEHTDAHVNTLKELTTLTSFNFIDRVLKGRVRQRYRLKLYNPETKKIESFEFYLRDQMKTVRKEEKIKKAKKKKSSK